MSGGNFDYYVDTSPAASLLLMSDRERSGAILDEREDRARDALSALRKLLSEAEDALDEVESRHRDRLGVGLCRVMNDVADRADEMADRMGEQSEEGRLEFARACVREAESNLLLRCEDDDGEQVGQDFLRPDAPFGDDHILSAPSSSSSWGPDGTHVSTGMTTTSNDSNDTIVRSSLSEGDVLFALSSFESLLRDVATSLRSVTPEEAGELAEAALSVARIVVWTASSFVDAVTPQSLAGTEGERTWRDEGGYDVPPVGGVGYGDGHENTINEVEGGDAAVRTGPTRRTRKRKRVRLLWPPLGPSLARCARRFNDACLSRVHPVAVTLAALTLWPAVVVAAIVGVPALATDHLLQVCYDAASPPPKSSLPDDAKVRDDVDSCAGGCGILLAAEEGAADVLHVSRLYYLLGRLVIRRAVRVARSQVDRRGGLGRVAGDAVGMAVDGALHPVRTAGMVLDGIRAGWVAAGRVGHFLVEVASSASTSAPSPSGGYGAGGGFGDGYV